MNEAAAQKAEATQAEGERQGDEKAADALVRCDAHKQLALEAARRSIVLLKNENVLPLDRKQIKTLAVFGA